MKTFFFIYTYLSLWRMVNIYEVDSTQKLNYFCFTEYYLHIAHDNNKYKILDSKFKIKYDTKTIIVYVPTLIRR